MRDTVLSLSPKPMCQQSCISRAAAEDIKNIGLKKSWGTQRREIAHAPADMCGSLSGAGDFQLIAESAIQGQEAGSKSRASATEHLWELLYDDVSWRT